MSSRIFALSLRVSEYWTLLVVIGCMVSLALCPIESVGTSGIEDRTCCVEVQLLECGPAGTVGLVQLGQEGAQRLRSEARDEICNFASTAG